MSAGTITLTNNSATVSGTGTAFTTDSKGNDFIVVIVGGVTYTLGVKSVESGTSITLIQHYGGPTATGLAWTAVPNATLVGITAQVAADVAKAIRGLNLDKANWQQVFSGTGTITVTLPDGSTYNGPAWNSITTTLNLKADKTAVDAKANKGENSDITSIFGLTTPLAINQGGLGATTAAGGRLALGLGTAALAAIGTGANQIPDMNSFVSSNSSSSGYIKLPGGTIIQWGYSPSGKLGSPIDTAFPIPFTSTNYTVTVSSDNAAAGSAIVVNGTTQRLNNSVFRLMNSTGDTGYTLFWQAIGR